MKIYTRTGDDGSTGLFHGGRVSKGHHRVEAYGTVDELNAVLGVARAQRVSSQADAWLARVQHDLFTLGADLATPDTADGPRITRVTAAQVAWLERTIDTMDETLPPLRAFILPGGCGAAAALHVARTVCRRAERDSVRLAADEPINTNALTYLNRLSDMLFTLARYENAQAGVPDVLWDKAASEGN